jgi:fructokinase
MKNGVVVGIGEALWDMLPSGKQLGGAPANFAYHVGQMGVPSCVVSALGNDALGDELQKLLDERQVNGVIARVEYPTGTVQVTLNERGVPQYEIVEDVAWDNIPHTDDMLQIAKHCRAVCFGSLAQRSAVSRDSINAFLDAMEPDALVVFDINLRQHFYDKAVVCDSLKRCNILKINDEELLVVADLLGYVGCTTEEVCKQLMADYDLKILILTCGENGSYVYGDGNVHYEPTPKVVVADTVGAGDSFTAAFVAMLLKGSTLLEAHRKAVEVSAYICTQQGAMPKLPEQMV